MKPTSNKPTPLPSPLGIGHRRNHGATPIYVYDSAPAGGRHYNQISVAQKSFGVASGHLSGPSGEAYAIPTRLSYSLEPVTMKALRESIKTFCDYAKDTPNRAFHVTRIGGCRSLAFFNEREVAETFLKHDPGNLHLPGNWELMRNPNKRRVCLVTAMPGVTDEDVEAVKWLLKDQRNAEIVVPGVPLQFGPAMTLAEKLDRQIRLFTAEAKSINGRPRHLMEELAWYCDFAIIIKPNDRGEMSPMERKYARIVALFVRHAFENKIGVRAFTAGVGLNPSLRL